MKTRLLATACLLVATISLSAQIEVVTGGNVGVGTSSPGNKLTVEGTGDVASFGSPTKKFYFASDTNGTGLFTGTGKTGNGLYANSASNYFSVSTNGTERFRIDASGNIGIGTTNPVGQFHLYGGNPGALSPYYSYQIRADTNGNTGLLLSTPTANAAYIYHNTPLDGASAGIKFDGTTRSISFFTVNGAERMRIDGAGNVGIGTTSPSQKLEVAGSVRATSFISNSTTYADFVFEPGYRLPALREVEANIKELGHLPGIPSEAEAKEHGIDLAAMQGKLLQKIEELTLHVIAQEKEIEALKRQQNKK